MSYVTGIASACDLVVDMQEPASIAPFMLTQDPASDGIELRFFPAALGDLWLTLLDASGRIQSNMLIPKGTSTQRISTTGFASGVHMAWVCDADNGCWAVKWVKE